jgi:hypothetical protein
MRQVIEEGRSRFCAWDAARDFSILATLPHSGTRTSVKSIDAVCFEENGNWSTESTIGPKARRGAQDAISPHVRRCRVPRKC